MTQTKAAGKSSGGTKAATHATVKATAKNTANTRKTADASATKKKLSYKDQRELDGLPALISQLESQQKAIEQELFDGTLYSTNAKRAAELTAHNSKIDEAVMADWRRWEDWGT